MSKKDSVCITDDEGNVHEFDNFSDLIEYVDTCGQMSWLPDGYTWKIKSNVRDSLTQQMEKHGIDFFDCPTKDLEDGDIMIPTLQEEVEFTGRRQVTDNVKKLIKERETE